MAETAMRLSEAIRLGSLLRPQGRYVLMSRDGKSCALGAALEAIGAERVDPEGCWGWVELLRVECPVCDVVAAADIVLTHLNDDHEWTRERIADWVEGIEPQEAEAATGHELHEAEVSNAAV